MSDIHNEQIDITIGGNPTDDWNDEIKEDENDNIGTIPSQQAPTFRRRMSSEISIRLERRSSTILDQSGMGAYIPDSIVSHIPGLNRTKTQALKATYFCNICFTKYPIQEGFTLTDCQHQFCIECIKHFFINKISNGNVYIKCFYPLPDDNNAPCSININENDIHKLMDNDAWNKYLKFKSNLENTLSRQCPYCDNTQIGDKNTNIIICNNDKCARKYCLFHSNAHPITETCESYDQRTAKETKINQMALNEMGDGCKPCPKCQFRIIKNGGCNHMKCVKCNCSFCWLCLEEIEDTELPNHYKDENSKCKGQQFQGMDNDEQPPLTILIILICCMCIFCIPGFGLGIVFGCICHPIISICCASGNDKNIFETIFMCSFIWMIIPAVIILSILIVIWSGIKSSYDNIKSICTCLPNCPETWIDNIHQQQAQPQIVVQ